MIFYLIAASKFIDQAFLKQVNENNFKLLNALKHYMNTPEQVYYDYFKIMYGPWDRLDGDAPFINLDEFKPLGANYYPTDMTPEEFEAWLAAHPEDTENFASCFTMIRRHHDHLKAIPSSGYFRDILLPISGFLLKAAQDRDKPSFDGFFNHVLLHEISHGLGPGTITVDGRETTVRAELKELYSMIEECQADTLSVYNNQFLIDLPDSPMPPGLEDGLYASYLAGMFRSIRFGTGSAHGGAITIQLNYHLANGGFNVDANGLFYLGTPKLKASIRSLAEKILTIELTGDYDGAKELIDTYCYVAPQVQAALDKIQNVPTDVHKIYPY